MTKSNINSTSNLLIYNKENTVLPLNKDKLSKLIRKHSKGEPISLDILLNGPLQNIRLVKFQSIDEEIIWKATIRTKGGSGLSGIYTDVWCRILAFNNNNSGTSSSDLRKAFANVVQKLCTDVFETYKFEAFLSCQVSIYPLGLVKIYKEFPVNSLFQF